MNFYETLGVSRNSEPEVIEAAYRALMKKYHPDLWRGDPAVAETRAKEINEAFATLRDATRRRAYDRREPPEAPKPTKTRRKTAKPAASPVQRQPHRHRTRVQQFAKSVRAASRASPYDPQAPALGIVACLGLMALIALASRGPSEAQLTSIGPVPARPVQASLLSGGRKQRVCITNKTSKRVDYSLYWGGTAGRQYALDPGYYMIHSSPYSAAPLVEFFDNEDGEPARHVVKAVITNGSLQACQPNYSFQYKALDSIRWSGEDRYGLYGDERVEAAPPRPPFETREWET
jgi:curved DNA-binding protein CbpA